MSSAAFVSWLLTYLLHSTVLLGVAWLVCRALGDTRFALQEVLLRAALIGGLLTATLQIGLGIEPLGGAVAVNNLAASEPIAASVLAIDPASTHGVELVTGEPHPQRWSGTSWSLLFLALWAAGSSLALLVLGRSILDLRRLLQTRRFRPAGRLIERLAHTMGLRRPVRVSTSPAIAVPFATGIRRPEICCPERVTDLAYEHQRSLFAHELAHLTRRDPAWQLAYRLGEAVLFLQPLNRLVRRRLEEIAEHLTDERAVASTGDRLGLARCLVVVAHWGVADAPGMPAAAMAAGPRLDRRVRHLISGTVGSGRPARWTGSLLVALLAGSVVLLPAITPPIAHADAAVESSEAALFARWSGNGTPEQAPTAHAAPSESDSPLPASPALEHPPAPAMPDEIAPVPEAAPVPVVAPVPAVATAPLPERPPVVVAVPEAVPAAPAPAVLPTLAPVPETAAPPAPAEDSVLPVIAAPAQPEDPAPAPTAGQSQPHADQGREEARQRQRESQRERSEAEARAREHARDAEAMSRASAERARDLAREEADRSRLSDAERDRLRSEARELQRHSEVEARAREQARVAEAESRAFVERARELAREGADRSRLSEAEREELRHRGEVLRMEARERAREFAERARKLAEEAEAERRAEEERQPEGIE